MYTSNQFCFSQSIRKTVIAIITGVMLVSCGGDGGSSSGGSGSSDNNATTVTFSGGSLDELKALSSSLTFDHLEITGALKLPFYSSDTITVNTLTISSTGSIGYSYSTCEYKDAPSITIIADDDVKIDGEILLHGRSGTSVTSSATCNSCYGQDGGDISITSGSNININGRIMNGGGGGASIRYVGYPSSACSAGSSGNLTIRATGNIALNGSAIDNMAGRNFDNDYGSSGAAVIRTDSQFTMSGGSISTTGSLNFQANLADISGPITYGTLTESIGGTTDTTQPIALIINPQPNTSLAWRQPFQIQIQAYDDGMGLRNIHLNGFGHNQTHYESEFVNGVLSIDIASADTPTNLDIVATDNKGLQTSLSVQGLTISYPQETEPNNNLVQAQAISSGGMIAGNIFTGDSGYANTALRAYIQNLGDPNWASRLAEDVYAITLSSTATSINVSLDFSGNSQPIDIDIYLLNSSGTAVVAASYRDNIGTSNYTESINYSGATSGATYYLALQAYNVTNRANYRLTRNY